MLSKLPPNRSRPAVIAYLAYLSLILAFGVDVALPAFPEIRSQFGMLPDDTSVTLTVTLYFLGFAVGQLFFGVLSDRIGRQKALLVGIGIYMVGAVASALAPTFPLMLAARGLWGIGSSSPGVMRSAIARDLYSGDDMSRIVTIVMAVFLIGPIFVPFVGVWILAIAPWQMVFYAGVLVATVAAAATIWFGETLAEDQRRPISLRPQIEALRAILTTPATVGRIIAQTMFSASFFVFLASSQPIIDKLYGRESQFAFWFGVVGITTIIMLIVSNRAIKLFGSRRLILAVASVEVVVSAGAMFLWYLSDSEPSFGAWFIWVTVASALLTVSTPLCNGLALEPMGEIAGTASAVLGFITVTGGALAGSVISSMLATSVKPMAVAYSVFAFAALVALVWADRRTNNPGPAQPEAGVPGARC